MKKTLTPFLILVLLVQSNLFAQKRTVGAIGFYNVENLFDTEDQPGKYDEEYTPSGERKWDAERYQSKQNNIANVISEMANGPDVVGLCEVENLFVLTELVANPQLARHNYQVIHQESPDRRGIDCALIYKPNRFKLLDFETIRFPDEGYDTRDILKVSGIYFGDTLHIFVNHWPSRFGGKADKRGQAAEEVRRQVDKLLAQNKDAKIIIMGDLNDDPNNKSVKKVLNAVGKNKLDEGQLYNASDDTFKQGFGTLYYRGAWNLFDQIIVSQGLMKKSDGVTYKPNSFSVFGPEWMRQKGGQYAGAPKRTFGGGVYLDGYSDHFPTYILLEK